MFGLKIVTEQIPFDSTPTMVLSDEEVIKFGTWPKKVAVSSKCRARVLVGFLDISSDILELVDESVIVHLDNSDMQQLHQQQHLSRFRHHHR